MGDIITERNGNARAFWRGIVTMNFKHPESRID
jgi:hypothetical protein